MAQNVIVNIIANSSKYVSEVRKAAGETRKMGNEAQGIRGKLQAVGPVGKAAFAAVGAAAVAGLGSSIKAATDLGEAINATNKVFGDAAPIVQNYAKTAAQSTGLAASSFNQLAAQSGALLTNVGFSMQGAAVESVKLTQRASDLASIFNTDVEDALQAVQAGLRGETEPLRRFGVQLSDAEVRAKAVAMGLADTTAEVDKNAKAQAALALIYEQSNAAAGDFVQTSGDLANAARIAAAEAENAKAAFGQAFQPIATAGMNFATDTLLSVRSLFGDDTATASLRLREAIEAVNATAAEGGDTFSTLADSLFHFAGDAELTTGEFLAMANAAQLTGDQFEAFRDAVVAQAEAMGKSPEEIAEVVAAIEGAIPPTEDLTQATEESTDATEDDADAKEEAAVAADTMANRLLAAKNAQESLSDVLRATADPAFAAVRAFQEYEDTLARVDEDGQRTAQEQLELAEAVLEAQGALDALDATGVQDASSAIAQALGISIEAAKDLLAELGILDGKRVTTTVVTTFEERRATRDATNTLTGRTAVSGRASGGPVAAGQPYVVGEEGPELFVPAQSGTIVPASTTAAMTASAAQTSIQGGDQSFTFVTSGDVAQDAQLASVMLANRNLVRSGIRSGVAR